MVVAEKQNFPPDHRHRRPIYDRMLGVFVGPRINRPRPEWNPLILRSMDFTSFGREHSDMANDPAVFQSLLQNRFWSSAYNISPRRSYMTPVLNHPFPYNPRPQTPSLVSHTNRSYHTYFESKPDVHIIPITRLDGKEKSNQKTQPVIEIDVTTKNEDSQSKPILVLDKEEESDVHVIAVPDDVGICDISKNSSLVRRSLTNSSQSAKAFHTKSDTRSSISDDIMIVDEPITVEESQSLKNFRLKKNTLVGGANKVHGNTGPDGYYTGDSMDPAGATYLKAKNGPIDIADSSDIHLDSDEEKPVNDVPNYPVYAVLKQKLLKECRQIDHIKGDGNCFFRALSKQLYGSERYHIVLRNLIVDITATNKNSFAQFVDGGDVQDHVERMSQEQSWATTCEIYAAATLLQRDIFMLTPDHLNEMYSWLLFKPVFKSDAKQTNIESHPCYITLCNTNGNHYDRIVGEHGGCNCFLPHPELEGVTYSVDLT